MRKIKFLSLTVALIVCLVASYAQADTREDVVKAVEHAAHILKSEGSAGLKQVSNIRFGDGNYVFVNKFDGTTIVHIKKHLEGKNLVAMGLKDDKGKNFFMEFTKVAKSASGEGWVDYRWTKPGDKTKFYDKTTFIKSVKMDGQDVYVGAGMYLD